MISGDVIVNFPYFEKRISKFPNSHANIVIKRLIKRDLTFL